MSFKKSRGLLVCAALAVTLTGVVAAGTAVAAARGAKPLADRAPAGFAELPPGPLPHPGESRAFTATYRNDTPARRTVAPQLLVLSPDAGPFLAPSDVRLERRAADGHWEDVPVRTTTGTLYTGLAGAHRTLPPGATLTEVYRLTVAGAGAGTRAGGTVRPRVALYG
ncbi:hypothetical protein [Streptomyces zinciresistens]|uniref:hypothetical protein n=1 Tax=Streptomyces zinciresistens TaxID=1073330 RepID=UPI0002F98887|nr:hypothetical protein [Streptomyces zinciresistens]